MGISGRLFKVSGGRKGQSPLGLGLKVPVLASRRDSSLFFLLIPHEVGHV